MGYLKQKKQLQLQKKTLFLMSLTFLCLVLCSFTDMQSINDYRLQIYILNILFLLYCIIKKSFFYIFINFVFVIINYNIISSVANITNNIAPKNGEQTSVFYNINSSDINIATKKDYSIININFSKNDDIEYYLSTLKDFITSHNTPVIVVGDLKKPLWNKKIIKFMKKTGLKAKNHIIYDSYSPFYIPSINVLAFDNVGVKKIIKKNDGYEFILLAK